MNIKQRRTIRKYTQQPVSDELLNQLIEDASRTQTMGNLQLYSVVVTRAEEKKEMLAPAHFFQPMVTQAPVVLTICADFRRTSDWCLNRKANPGYDNVLSFLNAATDALLFTQTFCCLAEEKGLQEEFSLYEKVAQMAPEMIAEKRQVFKGVSPNVDFYSGLIYRMLDLPCELFTPLFAMARIAGWSAHRIEEIQNAGKIIRPAYISVKDNREYIPLGERLVE